MSALCMTAGLQPVLCSTKPRTTLLQQVVRGSSREKILEKLLFRYLQKGWMKKEPENNIVRELSSRFFVFGISSAETRKISFLVKYKA